MYFHKYPLPANFEFAQSLRPNAAFHTTQGRHHFVVEAASQDIYRLSVQGRWAAPKPEIKLAFRGRKKCASTTTQLRFDDGEFSLRAADGATLLAATSYQLFGQCGPASLFEFTRRKDWQYYGLGEKWSGFEHSGKTTKFWNTDVWGDFSPDSYINGNPSPDPVYVSIPYLIIKQQNTYVGLMLDTSHPSFISTGYRTSIADQMEVNPGGEAFASAVVKGAEKAPAPKAAPEGFIHLGTEDGPPVLYIIVGPSLAELTRKFQTLIGTTPRPPGWALGYHQCRWGYESERDLVGLDREFRRHGIPVDGLWLDIDYMDGYRVFTMAEKHFPKPKQAMKKLAAAGRKIVPIIDPGVKRESGYAIYERGRKAGAFCQNPQGREYVGLVWPGQTVFPDFSLATARTWWTKEVADFASAGIFGAWLDMNDPSTGPSDNHDMLFDRGRRSHRSYHNQYALGMAAATHEGFLKAHPEERPFLLSRSGCTGSNRFAAIWTGDNYSNYFHLRRGISTTLNLALSGVPFNGPDAGGFGGDTTPPLIRDWYKACFLFPFFRNHSMRDTRPQEPWAFDRKTTEILRRYIRLRYRFRPYLYQLFLEHERTGEAILRPLFYDFTDNAKLPLGLIDDQFMVGPHLMQAPFLGEKQIARQVVLPGQSAWYDLSQGTWISSGKKVFVKAEWQATPAYVRDQSILPLARLAPSAHDFRPDRVDFHIFAHRDGAMAARYVFDDGKSFGYQAGKYSELQLEVERRGETLTVTSSLTRKGYGVGDFTLSTLPEIEYVIINGRKARRAGAQGIAITTKPAFKTWKLLVES